MDPYIWGGRRIARLSKSTRIEAGCLCVSWLLDLHDTGDPCNCGNGQNSISVCYPYSVYLRSGSYRTQPQNSPTHLLR
ncbi:hypothetical protein VTN02DRAFT_2475 [Thermoascus thermophilus]